MEKQVNIFCCVDIAINQQISAPTRIIIWTLKIHSVYRAYPGWNALEIRTKTHPEYIELIDMTWGWSVDTVYHPKRNNSKSQNLITFQVNSMPQTTSHFAEYQYITA